MSNIRYYRTVRPNASRRASQAARWIPPVLFTLVSLARSASAFETDQLTNRQLVLPNADEPISAHLNESAELARVKAQEELDRKWRKGKTLTDREIGKLFRVKLAHQNPFNFLYWGARIEGWAATNLGPRGWAIYPEFDGKDANILQETWSMVGFPPTGIILNFADILTGSVASPTFEVSGSRFGADKLSHFTRLGYRYWRKSHGGRDLVRAIRYGMGSEGGILGKWGTGVYSVADLAANYAGYVYFCKLVAPGCPEGDGANEDFYYRIERDADERVTIVQNREVRISEYATDDWDEYLNPNVFVKSVERGVRAYLRKNRTRLCAEYAEWRPEEPEPELLDVSAYADPDRLPRGDRNVLDMNKLCSDPAE